MGDYVVVASAPSVCHNPHHQGNWLLGLEVIHILLSQGVQNSKTNAYASFATYYLLVASAVEKEDGAAQDAVDEGEGAVQPRVLLIGGQSAQQKTHKHHRHDDQVGSLDKVDGVGV